QFTAYELSLTSGTELQQTVYKVDCSLKDVEALKKSVREALRTPDGNDLLKTYHVEVGKLEEVSAEAPAKSPVLTAPPETTGETAPPPAKAASKSSTDAANDKENTSARHSDARPA